MKIVYAKATTMVLFTHGRSELVTIGSHWPANDPVVVSHPDLFSADPYVGLSFSEQPKEEALSTTRESRRG